jgi:hypothetical protein
MFINIFSKCSTFFRKKLFFHLWPAGQRQLGAPARDSWLGRARRSTGGRARSAGGAPVLPAAHGWAQECGVAAGEGAASRAGRITGRARRWAGEATAEWIRPGITGARAVGASPVVTGGGAWAWWLAAVGSGWGSQERGRWVRVSRGDPMAAFDRTNLKHWKMVWKNFRKVYRIPGGRVLGLELGLLLGRLGRDPRATKQRGRTISVRTCPAVSLATPT